MDAPVQPLLLLHPHLLLRVLLVEVNVFLSSLCGGLNLAEGQLLLALAVQVDDCPSIGLIRGVADCVVGFSTVVRIVGGVVRVGVGLGAKGGGSNLQTHLAMNAFFLNRSYVG